MVVLILRVAIDECQFSASCRLFFPLRAADIRLAEDPLVAHIKRELDKITASLRSNVCGGILVEVHTRSQEEACTSLHLDAGHTHTYTQFGHSRLRLCDSPTQAWQSMSGRLPAIAHLRRENRRLYQKLDELIGARLEQPPPPPNRWDVLGCMVVSVRVYHSPGLTVGYQMKVLLISVFKKRSGTTEEE